MIDRGAVVAEGTADELKWQLEGERVSLVFADGASYEIGVAELGGAGSSTVERRSVEVATDGSAEQVRQLLDRMDKVGASVDKVSIHQPSLDDVFLALTSGRTR
jgi:ABC-2 type transport system ATP-binding protein